MKILAVFVCVPLFASFLMPIIGRYLRKGSRFLALATPLITLAATVYLYIKNPDVPVVYAIGSWIPPFGIAWLYDHLTLLMLFVVNIVTFFAALYSTQYMKQYTSCWQYYCLLMLLLTGLNGVVISGDLFNVFVFLEITSIASYALVAYGTEAEELEASFKYMVLGSVASTFILMAIALLYAKTGTLNMFDIARVLNGSGNYEQLKLFVAALFMAGFGMKTALIPFHAWLPDAHPSAPAPISAMLSGVVIKVIGVYALARIIFNIFSLTHALSELLLVLGGLSMVIGVFLALGQWDFKRLLAYHSISQIGYVVIGLALGTPLGIAGGLFHLLNHSIFKSLLFLNAGSVEYAAGTRELKQLGGLREPMPHTWWTCSIASLSIAGVPPLCGFWSKLIIIVACLQAGRFFYGALAIIVGVLTLASFLKIQKYVFLRPISEAMKHVKESPLAMCLAMGALAILCVAIGLFFKPVLDTLITPAADVLTGGSDYFITILRSFDGSNPI